MALTIINSFPMDVSCKLALTFPSEMPITTDLVSYQSGSNVMNTAAGTLSATGTTSGVGTTTTSLTVAGCSTAITALASSYVKFVQLYNTAQVKDTGSFTLSLYAVVSGVSYNIEQYTSLIISSSQFTTGSITSFSITADVYTVSTSAIYTLTVRPAHAMPASSKL